MAKSKLDRSTVSVKEDEDERQLIGESELDFKERLRKIGSAKTVQLLKGELASLGHVDT
jgi:hypothetical protein